MNSRTKLHWIVGVKVGAFVLLGVEKAGAEWWPPPACDTMFYPWEIVSLPSVSDCDPSPVEPLTLGIESKKTVKLCVSPGRKYHYDYCGSYFEVDWDTSIDQNQVDWIGGGNPSSGTAVNTCNGYYTATFTPQVIGLHYIGYSLDLVVTDPDWSSSEVIGVPYVVLAPQRLAYWSFNGQWNADWGQLPVTVNNVLNPTDWNYGAAEIDSATTATLRYAGLEADGTANVTRNSGTVRFWFKPKWSSSTSGGSGPGNVAKLVEFYSASGDSKWGLHINSSGTAVDLTSAPDICSGTPTANFTRTINWTANQWHQIVVTYSAGASQLYVDGAPSGGAGLGVPNIARAIYAINIGSGSDGNNQARGRIDELETFNYPLGATQISQEYLTARNLNSDGDNLTNINEILAGTDPDNSDTDGDGVLDGYDPFPLDPNRWDPPTPTDVTPPVITLLQPVNAN